MIKPAGVSVYEQIADALRDQIINGHLPAGTKLPSETTLQQQYGVSRVTVRRALAILRNQGLVVVRRGHGGFVRDEPELQDLTPPAGSVVSIRMPTIAERTDHDIPEGTPVFVVAPRGSGPGEIYPGHLWQLRVP